MILINTPRPEKLPDTTIIYLSCNNIDIIVKTPETNPAKLKKEVEQFIKTELEKAKNQQRKYNTVVNALTEMLAE